MSCCESNKEMTQSKKGRGNSNFVIVVVLYILLSIIIGSCII